VQVLTRDVKKKLTRTKYIFHAAHVPQSIRDSRLESSSSSSASAMERRGGCRWGSRITRSLSGEVCGRPQDCTLLRIANTAIVTVSFILVDERRLARKLSMLNRARWLLRPATIASVRYFDRPLLDRFPGSPGLNNADRLKRRLKRKSKVVALGLFVGKLRDRASLRVAEIFRTKAGKTKVFLNWIFLFLPEYQFISRTVLGSMRRVSFVSRINRSRFHDPVRKLIAMKDDAVFRLKFLRFWNWNHQSGDFFLRIAIVEITPSFEANEICVVKEMTGKHV